MPISTGATIFLRKMVKFACFQILFLFLFFFLVSAQFQHFEDLPLSEEAELEGICTLERFRHLGLEEDQAMGRA